MEDGHDPALAALGPLSAQGGDAGLLEDGLTRHIPGQQDDARVDQTRDLEHIRTIEFDLGVGRFAECFSIVTGRQAEDRVGDVHVRFGVEVRRFKDFIQQLSRAPDERLAFDIFLGSRRFTDDEQLRPRVAAADDDVRARVRQRIILQSADRAENFIKGGILI